MTEDAAARVGGNSGSPEWVPRPDPTTLTTQIVDAAKGDLRRELAASRELFDARLSGMAAAQQAFQKFMDFLPADLEQQAELQHRELDRRLTTLSEADQTIRQEITIAIANSEAVHEERFGAIRQQFTERDVRSDQDKKSSKEALDAALLAQKESVSQQNDANTTAATKSETSFTKQIDQIGTLIATLEKSLTDRITELKERIDRGEGGAAGAQGAVADRRASTGQQIAGVVAVFLFISLIVSMVALASHLK